MERLHYTLYKSPRLKQNDCIVKSFSEAPIGWVHTTHTHSQKAQLMSTVYLGDKFQLQEIQNESYLGLDETVYCEAFFNSST